MSCKWPKKIGGVVTIYRKKKVERNKSGQDRIYFSYEIHPRIGSGGIEYSSDEKEAIDKARKMADGLSSGTFQALQQIEVMTPGDVATWKEIKRIAGELHCDILPFLLELSPLIKRLQKVRGNLTDAVEHWVTRLSYPTISVAEAVTKYQECFKSQWSPHQREHVYQSLSHLVDRYGALPLRDLNLKEIAEEKVLWVRKVRVTKPRPAKSGSLEPRQKRPKQNKLQMSLL